MWWEPDRKEGTLQAGVIAQIQALQRMSVGDLRREWERLYGEPTRSCNREHLWRRLAWRVQELAHGGLTDTATQRIAELAPAGFSRARVAKDPAPPTVASASRVPTKSHRDPRLPSPGTVITRHWRGCELRLLVLDDGYELDGVRYVSLTEAARAVTGQHWNGRLFFGLTERKRRK